MRSACASISLRLSTSRASGVDSAEEASEEGVSSEFEEEAGEGAEAVDAIRLEG